MPLERSGERGEGFVKAGSRGGRRKRFVESVQRRKGGRSVAVGPERREGEARLARVHRAVAARARGRELRMRQLRARRGRSGVHRVPRPVLRCSTDPRLRFPRIRSETSRNRQKCNHLLTASLSAFFDHSRAETIRHPLTCFRLDDELRQPNGRGMMQLTFYFDANLVK